MRTLLFAFFTALSLGIGAQFPLSPAFSELLDSLDIRVNHPLESDFRLLANAANDYLESQLTLHSKREKLELRFHLAPERPDHPFAGRPHLQAGHLALNLGSNEEDAVTAVHSFDTEEMAVYNADWARMYTFRPKRSYSAFRQAQLVAIYRVGRGMAYTILLFDEAPNTLEGRQVALRFR